MDTQEHLAAIVAHCKKSLEIAKRRNQHNPNRFPAFGDDAAFSNACSQSAEAGWKATILNITKWQELHHATEVCADGAPDASAHAKLCNELAATASHNLEMIRQLYPIDNL